MSKRARLYVWCQILGWSAHASINLAFTSLYQKPDATTVGLILYMDLIAGSTSHLFRTWIRRRGWMSLPLGRAFIRLLAGSIAGGTLITACGAAASVFILHADTRPDWNWINVLPIVFVWSVTLFLWSAIYAGFHYFEGYRQAQLEQLRLQIAARESELQALRTQLNPHFVFNCLNSLRALILENPARAQSMVDALSNVLRHSLTASRSETVPLEDEVTAIQAYLELELIRFEDRLRIVIDIEPASLRVPVPPMLLQTLVENGVKHGIARHSAGGEIGVVSRIESDRLRLQVTNTGQLRSGTDSTRIGIENAVERLRLLYGPAASLILRNLTANSVLAEVLLPLGRAAA